MRRRRALALLLASACFGLAAIGPAGASAASPAWMLSMTAQPANFAPGGTPEYVLIATNVGAAPTAGQSTLEVTLPKAWTIIASGAVNSEPGPAGDPVCSLPAATPIFTCETSEAVKPGRVIRAQVRVQIPPAEPKALLEAKALIKGGGAQEAKFNLPTPLQSEAVPFAILPGFAAPLTDEDGGAATLAGSHPYQQTVSFGFPTENPGDGLTNDGHPRDFSVQLPRGLIGTPVASTVLCTEAELLTSSCPDASQLGLAAVTSVAGEIGNPDIFTSPLYNMVPPPGSPAELGTNVAEIGVFPHILADVRSDGDYGIETTTRDVIAFGQQPIFTVLAQLWGVPSAEVHDEIRADCLKIPKPPPPCPLGLRSESPLFTLPTDCPEKPMLFAVQADTWEEPSPPFEEYEASYESADLAGTPVSVAGCDELEFEPALSAQPTTAITDSPSGLSFELKQTQGSPSRASAPLRDLSMTLPAGLVVNPSQATGLAACSEAQIGYLGQEGGAPRFSREPQSCPAGAKIAAAAVTSPLLVQRNGKHELELVGGKTQPEPLHGSLYIAKPFQNPFGSLIATYLAIEDEKTGIIAKLAGEGALDPKSGRVSVSFKENPELPIEDVTVNLFGGPRGALTTPPTCATYTTEAQLIPWSYPQGEALQRSDSFQTTSAPGGGPCPSSEAQMPHAPTFQAGTLSPQAGKYSPLIIKLSRADGSQRWQGLEASLPSGLSAKLAGVAQCSEAQIAQAKAREHPEAGVLEQADPSCPAGAQIGTALAAAGSGPTPYQTAGKLYLAGPYKGAPLSVVTIAPAVAGPFDLGTVVIRSPLYLDPETAQVRIASDPFPAILSGVPVDLRTVAINTDRPGFSLNPTSCAQKSFAATITSTLGAAAPLSARFQVGGCKSLPYKPKLSAHLYGPIHRGGHPRFKAVLTAKAGEANTAAFSFTLPRSEFIDQGHFRTICTRVQFAAKQCPAGSVYGFVKAKSPLLDYTLEGPIYLRSSAHKLPDAVAALHGPASQPLEIDAVARIDSVKGRLRSRIETVPDAPITKVIVSLQGGKKGLFQNSTNICKGAHRISASFEGQNGKAHDTAPELIAQCKGKGKGANAKGKGKGKGGGAARR